ncbi:hypothetical protein M6B38_199920 [Iris pallida]|uniref:Uncharacterized protein n=1 Tax=Iris pallida TaxID=29817 RepID=A0AAX6EAU0_IRIPA|nr:hypothetical protein M6B38_199920 [Iris pallida]
MVSFIMECRFALKQTFFVVKPKSFVGLTLLSVIAVTKQTSSFIHPQSQFFFSNRLFLFLRGLG